MITIFTSFIRLKSYSWSLLRGASFSTLPKEHAGLTPSKSGFLAFSGLSNDLIDVEHLIGVSGATTLCSDLPTVGDSGLCSDISTGYSTDCRIFNFFVQKKDLSSDEIPAENMLSKDSTTIIHPPKKESIAQQLNHRENDNCKLTRQQRLKKTMGEAGNLRSFPHS